MDVQGDDFEAIRGQLAVFGADQSGKRWASRNDDAVEREKGKAGTGGLADDMEGIVGILAVREPR